ncbi:Uncharacterised protein [Enterobacter ludwigii]|nr:Uncharacterised protein [Enterobacter ludwigii]
MIKVYIFNQTSTCFAQPHSGESQKHNKTQRIAWFSNDFLFKHPN